MERARFIKIPSFALPGRNHSVTNVPGSARQAMTSSPDSGGFPKRTFHLHAVSEIGMGGSRYWPECDVPSLLNILQITHTKPFISRSPSHPPHLPYFGPH